MDHNISKNEEKGAVGGEEEDRETTGEGGGKDEPAAGGERESGGGEEAERYGAKPKQEELRQRKILAEDTKERQVGSERRETPFNQEEGREDQHKLHPIANIRNKYMTVFLAIIVLSVTILAITFLVLPYQQETGSATRRRSLTEFNSAFREVEASFPNQTTRFWRILRNRAAAHIKNPNPKKPLVFMFTAPPSAQKVLDCIANKFAQSLDYKDKEMGLINSGDYHEYASLDGAKKALDDKLKGILANGQTLLVLDADRLPVKSPLLFYEYCDTENAPYPRAAIIFTVRLPSEPDPSLTPAKAEGLVAQYLKETWGKQDYKLDDVPPLVARMTDTVVMVMKESDEIVERNCDT